MRISDGTFSEFREVIGVTGSSLTVEKMSNSSFLTPWKTWVQVVGNDMGGNAGTERTETISAKDIFRIGGYFGATYRFRYNDAVAAGTSGNEYKGGDALAITTSNAGFQTYTVSSLAGVSGTFDISPSGTVGLNSGVVVTLVDQDLNTSSTGKQSTYHEGATLR